MRTVKQPVSITAGSPYSTPHIQRPAVFPPSDGYVPPHDPLVDTARLVAVTAELARAGGAAAMGYGRLALSYPDLPADVLAGRPLDGRRICRTLSECTTAPRNGLVSGCYPYDDFYKGLSERQVLLAVKRAHRVAS